MTRSESHVSTREKVKAHRARLRAQGLRPIQIWVPDVRSAHFAEEARRQSLAVANSSGDEEDLAFIDSLYQPGSWEEA